MDSVTTKLTLPLWEEYYQYDKVNTRKYQNYKIIHSRLVENCIDIKSSLIIIYFVSNNSAIEKIYKTNFNLQKSRTYFNNMYHLHVSADVQPNDYYISEWRLTEVPGLHPAKLSSNKNYQL